MIEEWKGRTQYVSRGCLQKREVIGMNDSVLEAIRREEGERISSKIYYEGLGGGITEDCELLEKKVVTVEKIL